MVRVNFSKTGWIREILAYGADFKFGPRHVAVTVGCQWFGAGARDDPGAPGRGLASVAATASFHS